MREEIFRKLIHLSSLWMLVPIYFLERQESIMLFFAVFLFMIVFESVRRSSFLQGSFFDKHLTTILREHEKTGLGLTGAFFVVLAVLLSLLFFSKGIAFTAVAIMLLADTAAALIGKKWGTTKFLNKTAEGAFAFFATSFLIVTFASMTLLSLQWHEIALVSLAATLIEFFAKKIKIDDNLTITIGAGLVLSLFV